jgi:hypothetical protein
MSEASRFALIVAPRHEESSAAEFTRYAIGRRSKPSRRAAALSAWLSGSANRSPADRCQLPRLAPAAGSPALAGRGQQAEVCRVTQQPNAGEDRHPHRLKGAAAVPGWFPGSPAAPGSRRPTARDEVR